MTPEGVDVLNLMDIYSTFLVDSGCFFKVII